MFRVTCPKCEWHRLNMSEFTHMKVLNFISDANVYFNRNCVTTWGKEKVKQWKWSTKVFFVILIIKMTLSKNRSSPPEVSCKKCSWRYCKIHKKTPVLELWFEFLFNKVACLKACKFIQKRLPHRYFQVNFAKSLTAKFLKASGKSEGVSCFVWKTCPVI